MNKQLSAEQIAQLAPFEQYFGPAIRSGYSSYPGEANLQTMRNVWADLTGQPYPYHPGCSTCIFNIVKDMGLLYYAATGKDPYDVKKKVIVYKEPQPKPAPATKKTPAKK